MRFWHPFHHRRRREGPAAPLVPGIASKRSDRKFALNHEPTSLVSQGGQRQEGGQVLLFLVRCVFADGSLIIQNGGCHYESLGRAPVASVLQGVCVGAQFHQATQSGIFARLRILHGMLCTWELPRGRQAYVVDDFGHVKLNLFVDLARGHTESGDASNHPACKRREGGAFVSQKAQAKNRSHSVLCHNNFFPDSRLRPRLNFI